MIRKRNLMEKYMENLPFSQKLEALKLKMQELEKKYVFEFPTSFTFDDDEKSYNNSNSVKETDTINKMDLELFSYILNICEFTNKPQVVKDDKYSDFEINSNPVFSFDELYRGVRTIQNQANLLFEDNYHTVTVGMCNGLYTSPSRIVAFAYTRTEDFSEANPLILNLKLPKASLASDYELFELIDSLENNLIKINASTPSEIAELVNFADNLNDKERQKFICLLKMDISILATILGYDCVYDRNFPSIVILNRNKLVVSESTANKVREALESEQAPQPNH